jgi:hypothetical protein
MVTPEAAAALSFHSPETIDLWIERKVLHFFKGPEGVRICLRSLDEQKEE